MLLTAYELEGRPKDARDCECLYTLRGIPAPNACNECERIATGYRAHFTGAWVCYTCGHLCECGEDLD